MDPRKYNGAVFLGLNGIAVKSHGSTDSFGFANAIGVAADMSEYGFLDKVKDELRILHAEGEASEKLRAQVMKWLLGQFWQVVDLIYLIVLLIIMN